MASSNSSRQQNSADSFWLRSPPITPSTIKVVYSDAKQPAATTAKPATSPKPKSSTPTASDSSNKHPATPPLQQSVPRVSEADSAIQKFQTILASSNVDMEQLQKLSWKGIPSECRHTAWRLLMGYEPLNASRRTTTLQRKRKEYDDWVTQTFSRGEGSLDRTLWHQISIDVPRTTPGSPIFQTEQVQKSLERVLYCWAVRHPASGYVQGINDLLTPFYHVFLHPHISDDDSKYIDEAVIGEVEADSFWCLTKLLDGIQDNYTHAQPGIQRQIVKLKELVARIDSQLAAHLDKEGVEFLQFAFRWINCLLMRELQLSSIVRMWDTYLAEPDGFSAFHIYVCAAFLLKWSQQLQEMDFQQILMFLQSPPTRQWSANDVELLLSEAYMYKCLYDNSPNQYTAK